MSQENTATTSNTDKPSFVRAYDLMSKARATGDPKTFEAAAVEYERLDCPATASMLRTEAELIRILYD